jgi:HK97 family phage major capsid protein/HK97 family phage prohead protease
LVDFDLLRYFIASEKEKIMSGKRASPTAAIESTLNKINKAMESLGAPLPEPGSPEWRDRLKKDYSRRVGYDTEIVQMPEAFTADTFECSVSSEHPVERWFGTEILLHTSDAIDLDRVSRGLVPFLLNHDMGLVLGVIQSARISNKRLVCKIRWAKDDPEVEKARNFVRQGIMSGVSARYEIQKWEDPKKQTVTATRWNLLEVSLVSVPADPSVGIGRSNQRSKEGKKMEIEQLESSETRYGAQEERKRIKSIEAMVSYWGKKDPAKARLLGDRLIEQGADEQEARSHFADLVLGDPRDKQPIGAIDYRDINPYGVSQNWSDAIGLRQSDAREFSLVRLIQSQLEGDARLAPRETEISRELQRVAKGQGFSPKGLMVPMQTLASRALNVQLPPAQAAPLVGQEFREGDFIEALRAVSATGQVGITILEGLVGDVVIPRQSSVSQADWVPEGSNLPESQPGANQVTMRPKTVGCWAEYSKLALTQSAPNLEQLLRTDFLSAIGLGIDRAIINGSGVGATPRGIMQTPGINAIVGGTNGGAPTLDMLVGFYTALANSNASMGQLGWLCNPLTQSKLMRTQRFAGTNGESLWQDGQEGKGRILGYRAVTSTQLPSNLTKGTGTNLSALILGRWSEVLLGFWSAAEVEVNPYHDFRALKIGIRVSAFCDVQLRHVESFSVCTDLVTT